jgi:hypothetical protein
MNTKRTKRHSPEALRRKRQREHEQNKQQLAFFANSLRELLGLDPLYQITEGQR